ncbi:MAG: hypothetical protein Ct9H300mP19_12950 [Dehalococcoidia bacterium]|nr:MAG: hypothetical protein Ct9H300mP19_12950 [Dehalococcoidia bacterium]
MATDPISGEIYVADGYSMRESKIFANGELLFSWGESGTDEGQFNIVHNIATEVLDRFMLLIVRITGFRFLAQMVNIEING